MTTTATTGKDYAALAADVSRSSAALTHGIPETMAGFAGMGKAYVSKALDRKFKEMIAFAISIAGRCDGCLAYHAKKAVELGVTREEILETIGVAVQMGGGPSMVYGGEGLRAFDFFLENHAARPAPAAVRTGVHG